MNPDLDYWTENDSRERMEHGGGLPELPRSFVWANFIAPAVVALCISLCLLAAYYR